MKVLVMQVLALRHRAPEAEWSVQGPVYKRHLGVPHVTEWPLPRWVLLSIASALVSLQRGKSLTEVIELVKFCLFN